MDIRSDRQRGLSYTEIARRYNIDPRTAKKYAQSETRPVYSLSAAKPSKLDPYKEQIAIWLEEAPYSAERILEKIREQASTAGTALCGSMYATKRNNWTRRQRCGLRQCRGCKGRWTGHSSRITLSWRMESWKKQYCFLFILGYSRARYIEFVTDMSTNTLIRCHANAFRYCGGYPEEILYDNMKQVVIKPAAKAGGQHSEPAIRGLCRLLWVQACAVPSIPGPDKRQGRAHGTVRPEQFYDWHPVQLPGRS